MNENNLKFCLVCQRGVDTSDPEIIKWSDQCASGDDDDGTHGDNIICPKCRDTTEACPVCNFHLEPYTMQGVA